MRFANDVRQGEILGWSLLHFLWQGCLIGGLYTIVRRQLPTGRADLRYAIASAMPDAPPCRLRKPCDRTAGYPSNWFTAISVVTSISTVNGRPMRRKSPTR